MKTFLICPIRNATEEQISGCENIVATLEGKGFTVHWPYRDTNQEDETGFRICTDNNNAIMEADVVHLVYDASSTGSHFDLGCAFAHNKKIIPLKLGEKTKGKSFPNMIIEWSKQ